MAMPLSERRIEAENRDFAGTSGVSEEAVCLRLRPAFRDERTGRVELARFPDGRLAPFHLIAGLPEEWALSRDQNGTVSAIRPEIVCGFVRGERFFTRAEAAELGRTEQAE